MLVLAVKPGHDGAIAAIKDRKLLFSLESEKDSFGRYALLNPMTILDAVERLGELPDVFAIGGWYKAAVSPNEVAAGYSGAFAVEERPARIFGRDVKYFSSSHTRSAHLDGRRHGARPMTPPSARCSSGRGSRAPSTCSTSAGTSCGRSRCCDRPGDRYAIVFGIADPKFPEDAATSRLGDSGKLMALAAFADADDAPPEAARWSTGCWIPTWGRPPKRDFADTAALQRGRRVGHHEVGGGADHAERSSTSMRGVARERAARGHPALHIGRLRAELRLEQHVARAGPLLVRVRPALRERLGVGARDGDRRAHSETGDPRIEWDVYCGLDFVSDAEPDAAKWTRGARSTTARSRTRLPPAHVIAWVQGRWEMGPRALGNRSLLAEPFNAATRDRLNEIKLREDYRPIAPMLPARGRGQASSTGTSTTRSCSTSAASRSTTCGAVTHVDGSARAQTVTQRQQRPAARAADRVRRAPRRRRAVQHLAELQGPRVHQPDVRPRGVRRATGSRGWSWETPGTAEGPHSGKDEVMDDRFYWRNVERKVCGTCGAVHELITSRCIPVLYDEPGDPLRAAHCPGRVSARRRASGGPSRPG